MHLSYQMTSDERFSCTLKKYCSFKTLIVLHHLELLTSTEKSQKLIILFHTQIHCKFHFLCMHYVCITSPAEASVQISCQNSPVESSRSWWLCSFLPLKSQFSCVSLCNAFEQFTLKRCILVQQYLFFPSVNCFCLLAKKQVCCFSVILLYSSNMLMIPLYQTLWQTELTEA